MPTSLPPVKGAAHEPAAENLGLAAEKPARRRIFSEGGSADAGKPVCQRKKAYSTASHSRARSWFQPRGGRTKSANSQSAPGRRLASTRETSAAT